MAALSFGNTDQELYDYLEAELGVTKNQFPNYFKDKILTFTEDNKGYDILD